MVIHSKMKKSVSKPEVVAEQPKVIETKIVKKAIVEETTPEIEAVVEENVDELISYFEENEEE